MTGIITQPISGAKKEGVEGFFKGLGKGLIGTVARPVSGMVDFASSSLEGIRKYVGLTHGLLAWEAQTTHLLMKSFGYVCGRYFFS